MSLADLYKKIVILCAIFALVITINQPANAIGSKSSNTTQNTPTQTDNITIQKEAQFIRNIEIEGTNVIKPEYVKTLIDIKAGDEYDTNAIQRNLKNIYETGFFTERMRAIPVENSDNTITLKIVLEENIPVTDFLIDGNSVIPTDEILQFLLPLKGQPQNYAKINEAIENIQNYYAEKGYILARISSLTDDPDGTLNIEISEGIINKIMISGNHKTKNYIIERNILTEPGMVYNEDLIKADLVRLYATQAFKDVNREIEPSEQDANKYNVTITVDEQRTAQISVGGGLDSGTGIFGSLGISDNNFRGMNQRVGLNFMLGSGVILNDASIEDHLNIQAELSFFEPYFINADTSLMSKIYYRDFGSYQVPLAIERRFGIQGTAAHIWKTNRYLSTTFTAGLENVDVSEGDAGKINSLYRLHNIPISKRAEQLEGGLFLTLAPGLTYDTRDTTINTRRGTLANFKFEENIALNNTSYTHGKLTGMFKQYMPVASKSSFSLTARAGGNIHGNMPEVMAYRLGGPYTVRGFRMSGVGTGDAFVMGSAELNTPFFFLDRIKKVPFFDNVKLSIFVDAGKIFHPTISDIIYDRPMQAITAGVGIKVYIPGVGPLSVDYGIPLTNPGAYGNSNGYFTFGVGDLTY